jgi:BirA family transcriptional regulator, biotin operon repressor / biotin---[acetyl-CoA-carboxylase] ligase
LKIIKLNAIASTNSFLKELTVNSGTENFTVVVTNNQTNGRGQQDSNWVSEPNKNLTFSVFVNNLNLNIQDQKHLNFAISLAVYNALIGLEIKDLSIKWPNDIMAVNRKLCGILIENSLQKNKITSSIIGIGLNVNQTNFPNHIKKVSSLKLEKALDFNLDSVLEEILKEIKKNITLLIANEFTILENDYLKNLYNIGKIATFRDQNNMLFNGIIVGISKDGLLQIKVEDDIVREFGIKEVSFA